MPDAQRFKIENGVLAFSVVDTLAVGYLPDWQTPGGVDIDVVTLAAYTESNAQWSCQVQTATLDPTANNNDETTDPTWCSPAKTTPNPGETSWAVNGTYLSDVANDDALWSFLYLHDTEEAYFLMGLAGESSPPMAVGRCRIIGSQFGGAGRVALTSTLGPLPVSQRFDVWTGVPGTAGSVIEGLTNAERPGVITLAASSANTPRPAEAEAAA
jgi:hypothetical protein